MPRVVKYIAGAIWYLVVFWLVFVFTFPSDAVSRRITYEVDKATNGAYDLTLSEIQPWWFGLAGRNMIVSRRDLRAADAEPEPYFFADTVAVRVGVFSLLRRMPFVQAMMTLDDASLSLDAQTAVKEGDFKVRRVSGEVSELSLGTMMGMMSSDAETVVEGAGGLDLSFDLKLADGLESADGEILISSDNLRVDRVAVPSMGFQDQGVGLTMDEFDLRLRGQDGALEIIRGAVRSNLLDIDVEGELTLADRVERSRVRMDVEIGLADWSGTDLEVFRLPAETAMRSAKWADETYHYTVSTTLNRFGIQDFRPERERTSRSTTRTDSTRTDSTRTRDDRRPPLRPIGERPTTIERPESVSRTPGSALERRKTGEDDFEDEFEDEEDEFDEELEDEDFLDDELDEEGELDDELDALDEDF